VEYSAAEAAWRIERIERDQACAEEHRKSPRKPLKPPRPRGVDIVRITLDPCNVWDKEVTGVIIQIRTEGAECIESRVS